MSATLLDLAALLAQATPAADTPRAPGAEELFRRGVAAYDRHEYESASQLFQQAYRLSNAPKLLFNIGQALYALGKCDEALERFDELLARVPGGDPLVPRARARRDEMRDCASHLPPVHPVVPPARAQPPAVASPVSAPQQRAGAEPGKPVVSLELPAERHPQPRSKMGWACGAAAGAAATFTVTGLIFGGAAMYSARQTEQQQVWDTEAARIEERGSTFATISQVTLIGAAASAATAVAFCWLARR
jgi:tetratricopeptide (TPR) repeat protein